MESANLPVVMIIGGTDPTGGAGITADLEAIISQGGHAVPVVSCITVQDTCEVMHVEPIDAKLLLQQARAVLEDLPVDVIKIGLLGSDENIQAVHEIIADYPDIPVVFDPILAAGGNGHPLVDENMIDSMLDLLIPEVNLITPNSQEILQLVPEADGVHAAALALLDMGCEYILVTGTHDNTPEVINRLYGDGRELKQYKWERLPHSYHGSGCTLSSAIACLLAQDIDIFTAIEDAQEYTWHTLNEGYRLGMGQHQPNRFFWATDANDDNDENSNDDD